MTQALQTQTTAFYLLAHREHLSLEKATHFLVTRLRTRTPLGAVEYLKISTYDRHNGMAAYEGRIQLAVECCDIYAELFPREYRASQSPAYSIQKEQEFYTLVERRLFPLGLDQFKFDPEFFLPFIPVIGTQQHDWINGCCAFDDLQTVFRLVLVLAGNRREFWPSLGLEKPPALPLGALGWTEFVHACIVEDGPLSSLPMAFNMVCYSTGNPWLDAPPDNAGEVAFEWGRQNVARLYMARLQADEINKKVLRLNRWLDEDRANLERAVELWNRAAALEGAV